MLIIGAKGHAKEIVEIFYQQHNLNDLYFYDDMSDDLPTLLFQQFKILRTEKEARELFRRDPRFVLGIGGPLIRYRLMQKFLAFGGIAESIISPYAHIGHYHTVLEQGLNIMTGAIITNDIVIGEGTLINALATVHHDCMIGKYCEISPHASITGHCTIGNFCSLGTGVIVLPHVTIGQNVVVGAGALVRENIPANVMVAGIPAAIKKLRPALTIAL